MNILVSGASGFIGQNLVKQLITQGYSCICLTRQLNPPKNSPNCHWITVTQDFSQIKKQLSSFDIKGVFHLSGQTKVRTNESPYSLLEANIISTFNLLEFSKSCDLKWFIYASTGSVYGHQSIEREDSALYPNSLYGATKSAAEQLLLAYSGSIRIAVARLYFPYGYKQPSSQLISNLIYRVKNNIPIQIIPKPNGLQFPPTFIDDIANILIILSKNTNISGIYNISGQHLTSISEISTKIATLLNTEAIFEYTSAKKTIKFFPDIQKLSSIIDIKKMTPLDKGLALTINQTN